LSNVQRKLLNVAPTPRKALTQPTNNSLCVFGYFFLRQVIMPNLEEQQMKIDKETYLMIYNKMLSFKQINDADNNNNSPQDWN